MAEGEAYTLEEVDALYRTSLSRAPGGLTAPEALRWYINLYGQQGYPVGDATALAEARLARAGQMGAPGTTGLGDWPPVGDLGVVRRGDGTVIGDAPDLQANCSLPFQDSPGLAIRQFEQPLKESLRMRPPCTR